MSEHERMVQGEGHGEKAEQGERVSRETTTISHEEVESVEGVLGNDEKQEEES